MEKMTYKAAVTFCLDNFGAEMPADVKERMEALFDSLSRKSTKSNKPSKTQLENAPLKEALLDYFKEYPNQIFTCSELIEKVEALNGLSTSKVSALMRDYITSGDIKRTKEKGRSYFQYGHTLIADDKVVRIEVEDDLV